LRDGNAVRREDALQLALLPQLLEQGSEAFGSYRRAGTNHRMMTIDLIDTLGDQ
jgi:hypothetical protein